MYVINSLKTNRYSRCEIPSARDLFNKGVSAIDSYPSTSIDDVGVPVNVAPEKLTVLEFGEINERAAFAARQGKNPDHKELEINLNKL